MECDLKFTVEILVARQWLTSNKYRFNGNCYYVHTQEWQQSSVVRWEVKD